MNREDWTVSAVGALIITALWMGGHPHPLRGVGAPLTEGAVPGTVDRCEDGLCVLDCPAGMVWTPGPWKEGETINCG